MSVYSVLLTIIVVAVCAYFGVLRPTGLASRTSAQREEEQRRDLAEKRASRCPDRDDLST